MPNTFTQIYIQIVFAVKNRQSLIHPIWEDKLYQYISGIVQSRNQKMIAINGMPDHIHLFIGFKPSCSLSDLVREIKKSSSLFINQNKLCVTKFNWQEGYGAFSHSQSHISRVYAYVLNQKEHHKKITFKTEYLDFLKKYEIEYNEKYLFDWI